MSGIRRSVFGVDRSAFPGSKSAVESIPHYIFPAIARV